MINRILFTFSLIICSTVLFGQNETAAPEKKWNFSADANFYFIPDDFFILPIFKADKNKLHLEARYNYEDRETFSGWIGYNYTGGDDFEYTLTPMLGGVVGLSNGVAAGLEITLGFKGFEFYSELENFFDPKTKDNNYFYAWTDLTYAPNDWIWFGLSGQRTRLYQTDIELQKGLMVGAGLKNWELTTYVYNLGFDDPFLLLTLSVGF